jgi:hypothetical protein
MSPTSPDFRNRNFLLDHVRQTMAFYHPRAIDPRGGFYHFFKDDGKVYDAVTRHLVSSTRFIFNISGSRPSRWRPRRCLLFALKRDLTGTGTSGSGLIAGNTSLTTSSVPGFESSPGTIESTATKRVQPAKWIITPWAPAMKC